jgi:polyhydroxyalkanoate synthase
MAEPIRPSSSAGNTSSEDAWSSDGGGLLGSIARSIPQLTSRRFVAGLARQGVELLGEMVRIAAGISTVAPAPGDNRFTDPGWNSNPAYRRLAQAYVAGSNFVRSLPDLADLDWKTTERVRFALSTVVDAAAPTNTLPGNPAAIRRAVKTRGTSLLRGLRSASADLAAGRRLPMRSDPEAFRVGESIAATPGAVVYRNEMFELIQYSPTTERVRAHPVLILPSHVNKHYVLDLHPRRSFVRHAVDRGLAAFCISWRNPTSAHQGWGLDAYVEQCLEALDVVTEISGGDQAHVVGTCSAAMTASALLGYLARKGDHRVATLTLLLAVIDGQQHDVDDLFSWEAVLRASRRIRRGAIVPGRDMTVLFRARRPNQMIWNFWVRNYLMGEIPPPSDVLFWSDDDQNFPSALQDDFVDLFERSALLDANAATVFGSPIDLSKVDCDSYFLAAEHDHTSPWRSAFRATDAFGGRSDFVLSLAGHVQALIAGPRNPTARFMVEGLLGSGPDHWRATAATRTGSWWRHWAAWIGERSGELVPAPPKPGSRRFPAIEPAPGRYVHQPAR